MTGRTELLVAFFLVAGAPAAMAADIKDKVPPDLLAQYCIGKDYVTENQVSLMLPDGSTISGTIICAAEDLTGTGSVPPSEMETAPADPPPEAPKT